MPRTILILILLYSVALTAQSVVVIQNNQQVATSISVEISKGGGKFETYRVGRMLPFRRESRVLSHSAVTIELLRLPPRTKIRNPSGQGSSLTAERDCLMCY
jgi:hypothetical protein